MASQLGGKKDSPDLRQRLHALTDRTRDLARETNRALRQLTLVHASPAEEQQRRVVQRKLGTDLKKQLSAFTAVQTRIKSFDKREIASAQASVHDQELARDSAAHGDEQRQPLLALQLDNEIDFNEQLIEERAQNIAEIEGTIQEVNEIFRDLASIVNEQGDMLQDVEQHIESTVAHTGKAADELQKADEYHAKARRKAVCLCMFFLLVAAGVLAFFMLEYKKK